MSNDIFNNKPEQQQFNQLSQDAGYQIPVESVSLPSKGGIYTLGHPLHNEESVEIRCMTAREEDLMTSPALLKNGTALTKLMSSCLVNKSINPDDLLLGDRNAILIAIRITGYGPEYGPVKLNCKECKEEFDHTFVLDSLAIKPLSSQPTMPNSNSFNFVLPITKQQIVFKLLTGADDADMSAAEKKKKKLGITQVESSVTSHLMYSILSVNGETDKSKISKIVNMMPAGDARALRKHIDDIAPNVDMRKKVFCPHCSEETEVLIPIGVNFFWPDFG